jgi:hypothetical protein
MKQNKTHPPLVILFSGKPETVKLRDGSLVKVFVRELPDRYFPIFFSNFESRSQLIELCTYTEAGTGPAPEGAFPHVTPPTGYWPVPAGWADNLGDTAIERLHALAETLNFSRAAKWGKAQIAAKKTIAPLQQATMRQLLPIVAEAVREMVKRTDSVSTPSAPSSSA